MQSLLDAALIDFDEAEFKCSMMEYYALPLADYTAHLHDCIHHFEIYTWIAMARWTSSMPTLHDYMVGNCCLPPSLMTAKRTRSTVEIVFPPLIVRRNCMTAWNALDTAAGQ